MSQQKFIRREYLAIVKSLKELHLTSEATLPVKKLLRVLKMGWLTPGPEILKRLESKRLTPRAVLQRPELLQKKWFQELSNHEKPRWINVFWTSTAKTQLSQILGISKRRLLQLRQGVKLTSPPEYTKGVHV